MDRHITPEEMDKAYMDNMFGNFINEAYEALVLDKSNRPTITERGFVEVYLPIFSGKYNYKDSPYKATIDTWVKNVAKSDFNPVDVVDDRGNVLYTVPPMVDREAINLREKNNELARGVLQTKLLQAGIAGAKRGQEFSYGFFNEHTGQFINEKIGYNKTYNDMWLDIFKRYNIQPPGVDLKDKAKAVETKSAVKESDLEWDDDF